MEEYDDLFDSFNFGIAKWYWGFIYYSVDPITFQEKFTIFRFYFFEFSDSHLGLFLLALAFAERLFCCFVLDENVKCWRYSDSDFVFSLDCFID